MGAKVVGTPSGQAPNNFGDVIMFNLKHSGINGFVSFKQNITFPNDNKRGNCFVPDFMLTEKIYRDSGFDPNVEIKMAINLLNNQEL